MRDKRSNYGTALLAGFPRVIEGLQFSEFDEMVIMPLYELTKNQMAKLELGGWTVIDKRRYSQQTEKYKDARAIIAEAIKKKSVYTLKVFQTGYKFKKAIAKKSALTDRDRGKTVCFDRSHVFDICTSLGIMFSEIEFK